MSVNATKQELSALLTPHHQEHILRFWEQLNPDERKELAAQIRDINWARVSEWGAKAAGGGELDLPFEQLQPAPYQPLLPESPKESTLQKASIAHGETLLRAGKVGAFTVAGGQGTRLGYDAPKGTFPVTPIRQKSLFQIFAEGIARNQDRYQTIIPWYIMTSAINDEATRSFFNEHNYFGLNPANVMFFAQGMLPALDLQGKALLATRSSLALSPNGHGGSFVALRDSGALADMAARGITTLSYWQVDNPLVRVIDPLFIGMHDLTQSDMSSRALIKREPMEKLGHFCLLNNRLIIVEYSDMPDALLRQKDDRGRLRYRAGSPAIHVLSRQFIERLTNGELDFQPHRALKKISHIDEAGAMIEPSEPNAIKLEFFLFDALPLAQHPLVLEGDRSEQFAPIKNAAGDDSPQSCREAMLKRSVNWLSQAGIPFPMDSEGKPAAVIELSPRSFVDAKDVLAAKSRLPVFQPGGSYYID
ncbi:MAG: UTP--glucose-1-phosphate uridylyltransferase [Lentisphaeria bacterium]|jgi:UDP-N-acetylglucosamine/UDP-N-acetylgalactosamine diphosphorylase